jgi:hypothetical protein
MKRMVVLAVLAASLVMVPLGSTASADSPVIYASGTQCEAKWLSGSNQFRIRDNDLNDSDYCYVQYGWSSSNLTNRISRPQDVGGYGYYTVTVGSYSTIWWKVCKERQNDPDICSSVRGDVT